MDKNISKEENLSNIIRLLKNLSKENSKIVTDQIISKFNEIDESNSSSLVKLIYSNVSKEIGYLPYYTKICSKLAPILLQKHSLNIGDIIIKQYYEDFETLQQLLKSNQPITLLKKRIVNSSRFLAECYRYHVLDVNFYVRIINEFLPRNSTASSEHNEFTLIQIESLGVISTIVGRAIEGAAASPGRTAIQNAIEDGFELITSLSENKNVKPQTRYMLKNLIELKNNSWVLPTAGKAALDEEAATKEILAGANEMGKLLNKYLSSGVLGQSEARHSLFWHALIQSLNSTNYAMFKESILEDRTSPSSTPIVPLSPWLRRASMKSPSHHNHGINNNNNFNGGDQSLAGLNDSPMEIDDSFSLYNNNNQNNNNNNNKQLPVNRSLFNLDFNSTSRLVNESNLPSGFISPKIINNANQNQNISNQNEGGASSKGEGVSAGGSSGGGSGQSIVGNAIGVHNASYRESPEMRLSHAETNLGVILSIIDSKIVGPREIWKRKIMNKVVELKPVMKKNNKTEILAAILHNMCDNTDDYQSYLDLCLTLVKMDEEEEEREKTRLQHHHESQQQQSIISQFSQLSQFNLEQPSTTTTTNNNNHPPSMDLDPLQSIKKKASNRRSSMAVIQPAPSQNVARRSSIAVVSELNRRGSISGDDSPSICPPAPKLKSTPTLKSTPNPLKPNINQQSQQQQQLNNNNNNNNPTPVQPSQKKLKSSNADNFKDVLVESLQDDLALKMFVKKRGLILYFELLKDLYREFIIEIPLLLKCISLIQQGLYELSEEECVALFDLEELAQEQQKVEKQIKDRESLVSNQNQFFQWKTNTWEERPRDPPPPPNSLTDLTEDVFVL